ncbi:putative Zn-binding protein involved in type VI secretion [Mycobacterium sp. OTB74]|nr:putative Zn-binding protein involved in type VI secretion [Mycobacterium sp. OTB74]
MGPETTALADAAVVDAVASVCVELVKPKSGGAAVVVAFAGITGGGAAEARSGDMAACCGLLGTKRSASVRGAVRDSATWWAC